MDMKKYTDYIAPAALALGVILLVLAVACAVSAGNGLGSLEDTYYYLGMNLHHGRFTASDAGEVIAMLNDIGIADAVISGFAVFSIYARIPLAIIGLILVAAGAAVILRSEKRYAEKAAWIAVFAYDKVRNAALAAYAWVRARLQGRRCPVCGERLVKGAMFCGSCGTGLSVGGKCPDCGAANEPGAHFCNYCGRNLNN